MIKAIWKRIFISVKMDLKSFHSFNDGTKIILNRDVDNFDKKYVRPVNGIVIDSDIIPKGAEILIHHNATHGTYELPDYKGFDGEYISSNEKFFSIPESECFAWRLGNEDWKPMKGFEFGLRIFKPYTGTLSGILPTIIKNKLLITTGEFKDVAVMTKSACDYEIIYQGEDGKEKRLIRLRHFNEPENIREEIIAKDHETTKRINDGSLLVGLNINDCKKNMIL